MRALSHRTHIDTQIAEADLHHQELGTRYFKHVEKSSKELRQQAAEGIVKTLRWIKENEPTIRAWAKEKGELEIEGETKNSD